MGGDAGRGQALPLAGPNLEESMTTPSLATEYADPIPLQVRIAASARAR
ncbi:hypothetical protein IU459_24225 [Nocardia amamiensis]|uniref:Uncharacterized protein n=1 Tax=Nocardia amamiensis TaxID=404578 RepID=A0ABS0CVI0_9NOCA|nr:hypothetical protein [Nocardia amamiensis]MBF6300627.1 hypothetical protein [Nocardia amamiensis]